MTDTPVRSRLAIKAVIVATIAAGAMAFFLLDLDEFLTLDALRSGRDELLAIHLASPWTFMLGFFLLYVLIAALSVPGATAMTIAAGAFFGLLPGAVLVSVASTIGASLSFLVSRHLFRDAVQRRFGDRLRSVNEGIERDGALYLFTLRLVPAFPFFLVNVLMGLSPIPLRTFWWVSQLGMLAGTLAYVNAGTQLASLESASDVVSPPVLLSFALLAVFPWIARFAGRRLAARKIYRPWRRPRRFDRNLVVIGAGAAGLVSAYIAAAVRARVTLIEAGRMGGDCLNYGCVPSKALIRSARLAHQIRHADRFGLVPAEPQFEFREVMQQVRDVIAAVAPHDSVERYTKLGVEVLKGHARLVDPWTVQIAQSGGETRRLTARSIVIAAGARPSVPPLPGIEQSGFVTSDTIWQQFGQLDATPRRLLVLGGGPVGCELAQCFAQLGSTVTQVEMGPRLLPREDADVAECLRVALEGDGVTVLTGTRALRCERTGETRSLIVDSGGGERRLEYDQFLCAVGRTPRLEGYGLEELGIPVRGTLVANEFMETRIPNILAAGDVTGPYQFTHVAAHQAWYATVNGLFGGIRRIKADYRVIPWTTFTEPEIARVGLNRQEAVERRVEHEVTRFELQELDRAIVDRDTRGFVEVLTARGSDRILGVTIVGVSAGELLAEFVLAMRHGLGLNRILGTVHSYPTLGEANRHAAAAWKRAHAPEWLLGLAGRFHAWQRG
jgi:pyruvate/2-oxoglutarate dehydrogenase complex dihydrolipoamide dehydrogenase (E3) component/uncharacterized membrane protein YdjX (TVP38/TMEM64 family)